MKLHFDSNQEYQLDAIKAITDIFEGQPLSGGDFEFAVSSAGVLLSENGLGNRLTLSEEQILENVKSIQQRNEIKDKVSELHGMNFSVEMETGTGKTYVYLRTIYELNKLYGFKKFVIVVPSIAIREGVLKNLQITNEHFQSLYDKTAINFDIYDSKKVSHLRGFASANTIQILILNIDAFAKDENIINKPNDKLTGKKPIEFIQSTRPFVIVDEPQNMETEIRKKAIENLNPLCTLRYSATHTNLYNLMYSLNPVKAYELGLVKQIEVDSVVSW
jgi:type III restriction enzyme